MTDDPYSVSIVIQLVLMGVFSLLYAGFNAAKLAIIATNPIKISMLAKKGNKQATLLEDILKEPERVLSALQVGITLFSCLSVMLVVTSFSYVCAQNAEKIIIPYVAELSLIVVTLLMTCLMMSVGQLIPKRIILRSPERMALLLLQPIRVSIKVLDPVATALMHLSTALLKLCRLQRYTEDAHVKDEVKSLIELGELTQTINSTEKVLIQNILNLRDIAAKEVMTPRTEVYAIDVDKPFTTYIETIYQKNYSCIPVYQHHIDNIVGIIYIKDLFQASRDQDLKNVNLETLMRAPYFVRERKPIHELIKDLQEKDHQMAVLIDEYGGVSGIVTMNQLIQTLMGEDKKKVCLESTIICVEPQTYCVKGNLTLKEIEGQLNVKLQNDTPHIETIGNLVVHLIGHYPKVGEQYQLNYQGVTFKVYGVTKNKIEQVLISMQT